MKKVLLISLHSFFIVILFIACNTGKIKTVSKPAIKPRSIDASPFPIRRGINISHWLSQNPEKGPARNRFFTERDVEFLAGLGYDHIRLPVDEEHLWDEAGNKLPEGFQLLHAAIVWCMKNNMRIVVDMHIIRSHYFNSKDNSLWTQYSQQEKFVRMWLQLSEELKGYPTGFVAYELLNEAVADNPSDWNNLVDMTVKALRQNEPERKIIIGSNHWQSVNTFHELVLPEGDKNIILSFHFYEPFTFTHYRTSWNAIGKYSGPVKYPGKIIEDSDLKGLDKNLLTELNRFGKIYNRDTLLKHIQEPIQYAKRHGLQLYCGEFGCFQSVPRADKLRWYADVRYIFETNQIAWANWDYKGGFNIFDLNTGSPDKQLIGVLLGPMGE
jgi:endoglucanase